MLSSSFWWPVKELDSPKLNESKAWRSHAKNIYPNSTITFSDGPKASPWSCKEPKAKVTTSSTPLPLQGVHLVPAVYNFTLAFTKEGAPPTFRTLLRGQSCRAQLHIKLAGRSDPSLFVSSICRRISVSEIPYQDETKCNDWLHQLFQEKVPPYPHSPACCQLLPPVARIECTIISSNTIHSTVSASLDYRSLAISLACASKCFGYWWSACLPWFGCCDLCWIAVCVTKWSSEWLSWLPIRSCNGWSICRSSGPRRKNLADPSIFVESVF